MNLSTVDAFKKMNSVPDGIVLDEDNLRKYQLALVDIAKDVFDICEENGITCILGGGSALGAVRHQGFIPWDDDMDLCIVSSQFELFTEKFREKFHDKYWIHTCETENYGLPINRIRLKDSIFRGREDIDNDECGFFVDIMRIENLPDNPFLRAAQGGLALLVGFSLSCRTFYKNKKLMLDLCNDNPELKRVFKFKILLGKILSFASVKDWAVLTQKVHEMCRNEKSEYVGIPSGRKHYFGEIYKRQDFIETKKLRFEGYEWNVPKNVEKYLEHLYGDYLKIPKVEDREKHVLLELKFPEKSD